MVSPTVPFQDPATHNSEAERKTELEVGKVEPVERKYRSDIRSENSADETFASDFFRYNRHNESIYDDGRFFPSLANSDESVIKFDESNPALINRATLRALVVQMTSPEVIDYNLLCDFFLTYRTFSDSHTMMKLLIIRLIWALQYINSGSSEPAKIGKLVLLRTFVVLRHWILNYFVDDFKSDEKLCDLFALALNDITTKSNFVSPERVYELKIIADLKVHYLTQVNEFFGIDIKLDDKLEVFRASIPLYCEFKDKQRLRKLNTESSLHTNPSFRRLAMLSLYDLKVHHKCLVFDGATDENPQLSIQNLICHHRPSRVSLNDKLQEFKSRRVKKVELQPKSSRKTPLAPRTNYMNINNSSLALKKTARSQDKQATRKSKLDAGFSTNGAILLPSSRVLKPVPCSPVKKMEIMLKDSLGSPRKGFEPHSLPRDDTIARKDSFKKVVEGWKKSFHVDNKSEISVIYADPKEKNKVPQNVDEESQDQIPAENARADLLCARIIDELEFLIRCYVREFRGTDDIKRATVACSRLSKRNGSARRSTSGSAVFTNRDSKAEAPLQNILENQNRDKPGRGDGNTDFLSRINSSDFVRDSDNSSFCGKVTSIDWNDADLMLENSGEMLRILTYLQVRTPGFDSPLTDILLENPSSELPGYRSSDMDIMNDEIHDLSIAMSPQSMKKKPVLLKISPYRGQHYQRYSKHSLASSHNHDSLKSFLTYDSAFSFPTEEHEANFAGNGLKKKVGCHDLRKMLQGEVDAPDGEIGAEKGADVEVDGVDSSVGVQAWSALDAVDGAAGVRKTSFLNSRSRSLSIRRSTRSSTLYALTELPFQGQDVSISSSRKQMRWSDLVTENSIFSQAARARILSLREECVSFDASSTTSATVPGINTHVLKELAAIPDESFSARNPIKSALYKLEGKNGLDSKTNTSFASHDSSFIAEKDRMDILLSVLEIKYGANTSQYLSHDQIGRDQISREQIGQDQRFIEVQSLDEAHNSVEEIENAIAEDAIEYSSDIEEDLTKKPITPIRTRPKTAIKVSLSASNVNSLLLGTAADNEDGLLDPKYVLDEYTVNIEYLKVEGIMSAGNHMPFISSYDSRSLAEHFTMIENDMLQEIDWRELIELQWNKDLNPVNSWLEIIANDSYYHNNKGVNLVIARFNLMVNWIISEILLTFDQTERINVISRFIHVAYQCYDMQNFATLMQIILALTSEKLNKLRSTWNKLAPGDILTLKNLENLASPVKNFFNIRLCTNEIVPSRGCIPFVGLYLSDLVFNAERPKFAKADKNSKVNANGKIDAKSSQRGDIVGHSATVTSDNTCGTERDVSFVGDVELDDDRIINFSRFRTAVHIVKSLSQSIEWASQYNFAIDDELLRKCLYIKSLNEDEMKYCVEFIGEQDLE